MNHRPSHLRQVGRPPISSDRPGLPILDLPYPDHDARPKGVSVDMLILHYTGTTSAREAIDHLRKPAAQASAHYLVDGDGSVVRLVPEDRQVRQAEPSCWRGHARLNERSVGIDIVNPGHRSGYRDFPVLQLAALCDLCLTIQARHPIPPRNVVGHGDVAPDRQQHTGEFFDWQALAENGVGMWPSGVPDAGTLGAIRDAISLRPVRAALAEVGYRVAPEGGLDPMLSSVVRAFQRHWRPEAINGQVDDGTLLRLQGVLRLVRGG